VSIGCVISKQDAAAKAGAISLYKTPLSLIDLAIQLDCFAVQMRTHWMYSLWNPSERLVRWFAKNEAKDLLSYLSKELLFLDPTLPLHYSNSTAYEIHEIF
jgi:hypothetical protein